MDYFFNNVFLLVLAKRTASCSMSVRCWWTESLAWIGGWHYLGILRVNGWTCCVLGEDAGTDENRSRPLGLVPPAWPEHGPGLPSLRPWGLRDPSPMVCKGHRGLASWRGPWYLLGLHVLEGLRVVFKLVSSVVFSHAIFLPISTEYIFLNSEVCI